MTMNGRTPFRGEVGRHEHVVTANGVDLGVETFGAPAAPAILLIHGAAASMIWWEDEFCEHLAAGPRFVGRYDHRDTGRSVSYEPGAPPYALHDLAEDALGLLDTFNLDRPIYFYSCICSVKFAVFRAPAPISPAPTAVHRPGRGEMSAAMPGVRSWGSVKAHATLTVDVPARIVTGDHSRPQCERRRR